MALKFIAKDSITNNSFLVDPPGGNTTSQYVLAQADGYALPNSKVLSSSTSVICNLR